MKESPLNRVVSPSKQKVNDDFTGVIFESMSSNKPIKTKKTENQGKVISYGQLDNSIDAPNNDGDLSLQLNNESIIVMLNNE